MSRRHATRHDAGTIRHAHRVGDPGVLKHRAGRRNTIEIRRANHAISHKSRMVSTLLVRDNEKYVGLCHRSAPLFKCDHSMAASCSTLGSTLIIRAACEKPNRLNKVLSFAILGHHPARGESDDPGRCNRPTRIQFR